MRARFLTFSILALLLAVPASASIISPGSWLGVAPANNDGLPWYDQPSEDCGTCGFGWAAQSFDQVLTLAGGPAPFYVTGLNREFGLGAEMADWRDGNRFGWFEIGTSQWGVIFEGSASSGLITPVTLPALAGFWFQNPLGQLFTTTKDKDHFALTRLQVSPELTVYMLGIEDQLSPRGGVWDRNDMQIWFTETRSLPPTVPEPGSLTLLGLGLVGLRRWYRGARG